jgi:hypothetical protein
MIHQFATNHLDPGTLPDGNAYNATRLFAFEGGFNVLAKKRCPQCACVCYSFYKTGAWICPHCGFDLQDAPFQILEPSVVHIIPLVVCALCEN